jgi:hypothetical protein
MSEVQAEHIAYITGKMYPAQHVFSYLLSQFVLTRLALL